MLINIFNHKNLIHLFVNNEKKNVNNKWYLFGVYGFIFGLLISASVLSKQYGINRSTLNVWKYDLKHKQMDINFI